MYRLNAIISEFMEFFRFVIYRFYRSTL